jgi:hypothetical protein
MIIEMQKRFNPKQCSARLKASQYYLYCFSNNYMIVKGDKNGSENGRFAELGEI